ncbi:MAG: hypothetical protein ACR2OU_16450 [Thermomicrobiales bacterium]
MKLGVTGGGKDAVDETPGDGGVAASDFDISGSGMEGDLAFSNRAPQLEQK